MLHIFAEPGDISGDRLTITGKEYNHIRNVLRMKQGEIISVSDGQDGRDYRFAIDGFTDSAWSRPPSPGRSCRSGSSSSRAFPKGTRWT